MAITLYTSIKPRLLKRKVIIGTILAVFGTALLLYGTLFLSVEEMQRWGWLLFFSFIILISLGLIPYRRLSRLEKQPNKITLTDRNTFIYRTLEVPLNAIEKAEYYETSDKYGIKIWLKDRSEAIFLPYFTERSFAQLKENLED